MPYFRNVPWLVRMPSSLAPPVSLSITEDLDMVGLQVFMTAHTYTHCVRHSYMHWLHAK